jgi:ubiquinone/menaquinone biosynthesis C-methylase UbiE
MKDFEKRECIYGNNIASSYNGRYHQSAIMKAHDEEFAHYVAQCFQAGDRVLDLGCGSASLWPLWKKHLRGASKMIGIDISKAMLEEGKLESKEDSFLAGSVFALPLRSGSIDLVILSSMLHHIPDKYLMEALQEISRILDEHGRIVGREPVRECRLGDIPGWLSAALMTFRHLVYRLTHTREYPEPEAGQHHHAYVPRAFVKELKKVFAPKGLQFKFPISSYVSRCDNKKVSKIVQILDDTINHRAGHEVFYVAEKNYCDSRDVAHCIEQELELNSRPLKNKKEFLALLQCAAELLEKELRVL